MMSCLARRNPDLMVDGSRPSRQSPYCFLRQETLLSIHCSPSPICINVNCLHSGEVTQRWTGVLLREGWGSRFMSFETGVKFRPCDSQWLLCDFAFPYLRKSRILEPPGICPLRQEASNFWTRGLHTVPYTTIP